MRQTLHSRGRPLPSAFCSRPAPQESAGHWEQTFSSLSVPSVFLESHLHCGQVFRGKMEEGALVAGFRAMQGGS